MVFCKGKMHLPSNVLSLQKVAISLLLSLFSNKTTP